MRDIPSKPGDLPASYSLVSKLNLVTTLGQPGRLGNYQPVDNLDWECYAYTVNQRPQNRTTVWLQARFGSGNPLDRDIDLFDIGAQHRFLTVLMRFSSQTGGVIEVRKVQQQAVVVDEVLTPLTNTSVPGIPEFAGFYQIFGTGRFFATEGVSFQNRYVFTATAADVLLEVFFLDHPPGDTAQADDGGIPPIPPSAQD